MKADIGIAVFTTLKKDIVTYTIAVKFVIQKLDFGVILFPELKIYRRGLLLKKLQNKISVSRGWYENIQSKVRDRSKSWSSE